MRRIPMKPRADWRPGLRKYPFGVRSLGGGARWREKARYEFAASEIDHIESVADEIHAMALEATRYAVVGDHVAAFGYDRIAARLIEDSWRSYWSGGVYDDRAGPLVGRLTFAFDGGESLKLLEIHYDGAPGLFAASIIQRNWVETQMAGAAQFNALHEGLVERWAELAESAEAPAGGLLHFACFTPDPAREGQLAYVAGAAEEAGLHIAMTPLQNIGWDGRCYRDGDGQFVSWLYKLYPWLHLNDETFAASVRNGGVTAVEPAWTELTSNHGLLALLRHLYPSHPNLCRAGGDLAAVAGAEKVVQRSFLGQDCAPIRLHQSGDGSIWGADADAFVGPCLWLEKPPLFRDDDEGVVAVIDAWIVGGKCLGMSVRESHEPLVDAESWIAPSLFVE